MKWGALLYPKEQLSLLRLYNAQYAITERERQRTTGRGARGQVKSEEPIPDQRVSTLSVAKLEVRAKGIFTIGIECPDDFKK